MRTTTLDDEVAAALKEESHHKGQRKIVNDILRAGLSRTGVAAPRYPSRTGVSRRTASGIDLDKALQLARALEELRPKTRA